MPRLGPTQKKFFWLGLSSAAAGCGPTKLQLTYNLLLSLGTPRRASQARSPPRLHSPTPEGRSASMPGRLTHRTTSMSKGCQRPDSWENPLCVLQNCHRRGEDGQQHLYFQTGNRGIIFAIIYSFVATRCHFSCELSTPAISFHGPWNIHCRGLCHDKREK